VLAGESLHPVGSAAIESTLTTPTVAPATRAPDRSIPPELDALCVAALAEDAAKRPTARQMADAIQRYLDGDRDLEARRAIAARLVAEAKVALAAGERAKAMQSAGRALSLDPESDAAVFVTKLMLEPPAELPTDVKARLDAREVDISAFGAREGWRGVVILFAMLPVMMWNGIASWPRVIALFGVMALIGTHAYLSQKYLQFRAYVVFTMLVVATVALSRFLGPFLLIPPIVTMFAMALMRQHAVNSRPVLAIATMLVGLNLPLVLEHFGVLDSTWAIVGDQLTVRSTALEVSSRTVAVLVICNAAFVVIAGVFARAAARALREANRRLEVQAWHLRQLLPDGRA
jgi:serine/threonine-protein kinase